MPPSFTIYSEDAQPAREFFHSSSPSLSSQPSSGSYSSTSYPPSSISSPPSWQSACLPTFGSPSSSVLHLSPQMFETSQYTNLDPVMNNLLLGEADFHCSGALISTFTSSPHSATQVLSDQCDSYTDPWALFTVSSSLLLTRYSNSSTNNPSQTNSESIISSRTSSLGDSSYGSNGNYGEMFDSTSTYQDPIGLPKADMHLL